MKVLLIASVLLITSFFSQATTGNDLYVQYIEYEKMMSNKEVDSYKVNIFMGYVSGVSELMSGIGVLCVEKGVTQGQIYDIVGKYLRDNPAERNQKAPPLISGSLMLRFPCEE